MILQNRYFYIKVSKKSRWRHTQSIVFIFGLWFWSIHFYISRSIIVIIFKNHNFMIIFFTAFDKKKFVSRLHNALSALNSTEIYFDEIFNSPPIRSDNRDNDSFASKNVAEPAREKLKVGRELLPGNSFSSHAGEFDLLLLSPSMHFTFGKVPAGRPVSVWNHAAVSRPAGEEQGR